MQATPPHPQRIFMQLRRSAQPPHRIKPVAPLLLECLSLLKKAAD